MNGIFRSILELLVIFPGMWLAYLPVQPYLTQHPLKLLLWLGPLLLGMTTACGILSYALHCSTGWMLLAIIPLCMFFYTRTLCVSAWKSGSVFLAVVAVFSCINSLSRAINAMITTDMHLTENEVWFCFDAGLIYNLLCWAAFAFAWYPATHAARELVQDENLPITWKLFWMLPAIFIGLNLFMIPRYRETLYTHRVLQGYIIISLVLLVLLGLFYAMLLLIAKGLNQNARLQQKNQFLAMQQSRYDNLKSAIEETRQARHDLRHHFTHLSAMAEQGDLTKIKAYLSAVQQKIPSLDLRFSDHQAVDSVIGHYYTLAQRDNIPFLSKVDLPHELPIDEMDLCLVLSNLLENALEASLRTEEQKRQITVEVYVHAERLILIHVQNAFHGKIEEKDGLFQSSKRAENGIGIQSVRRIAEKNGGGSTFHFDDETFHAKVMLKGSP